MSGSSSAANSANSSNSSYSGNPTHSIGVLAAGFDVIAEGDGWRGLAAAKQLDEISPGVVLISLPGHSRGQAGVAVDTGHRWLLHCGGAFLHRGTVDGSRGPWILPVLESLEAHDRKQLRANQRRLQSRR